MRGKEPVAIGKDVIYAYITTEGNQAWVRRLPLPI
jgi:hypothetical protein